MNHLTFAAAIWKHFTYGVRQLRSNPGFALAAILSLALGIGANSAIFTLVDQILLRLLPVDKPNELVQLRLLGGRFGSNDGDGRHTFSYPLFLALHNQNTVFSGLTGQRIEQVSLVGDTRNEMVRVALVAGNYFQVLGVSVGIARYARAGLHNGSCCTYGALLWVDTRVERLARPAGGDAEGR